MTLEERFAHFTECQMATVEDLEHRKSFPKRELQRHRRIADAMFHDCVEFKIQPGPTHSRLRERLEALCVGWLK